ncbi:MAG: hypothetical protein IT433_13125 [Phycisphaerales bacterium]|nr:hypothetical protein [Phycisphaerales bacterium]
MSDVETSYTLDGLGMDLDREVVLETVTCRPPCEVRASPCPPTQVLYKRADGLFVTGTTVCASGCLNDVTELVSALVEVAKKIGVESAVSEVGSCAVIGSNHVTLVGTIEWTCTECRNVDRELYSTVSESWGWLEGRSEATFHVFGASVICTVPEPITIECERGSVELRAKKTFKTFTRAVSDVACCSTPNCCGCVGNP